jgi:FkbM family methyltransferase
VVKDKSIRVLAWLLAILLVAGGIFQAADYVVTHPLWRTKAFFAFSRMWFSLCPVESAKHRPARWARYFEPMVPYWFQVEPSVTMWLDPYDFVSSGIMATGTWEPETWRALKRHLPVGGTFVDVGAHIGWYSLKAAKVVGPAGRVIAVEPNRDTLVTLRDNIRASGAGAVIVVAPVACADAETTLNFYASPRSNTGESSLSLANASQEGPPTASYQVRARRLDDVLREAGVTRVDAVKIDVEGAEFLVLKGAVDTLRRYHPALSVELLDPGLKEMGTSVQEVTAFLRAQGYTPTQSAESNTVFLQAATP